MNPEQMGKDGVMAYLRALMGARGMPVPRSGWLKLSRTNAGLSTREVAKRLEVSHQAISHFEQAERKGRITLANLRRVADAMGCELVYGVVPKAKPQEAAKAPAAAATSPMDLLSKLFR